MNKMLQTLNELIAPEDRTKGVWLSLLLVINGLAQMVAVLSVMPFLSLVGDPSLVHTNDFLSNTYARLGFEETQSFLFFLGAICFTAFLVAIGTQATTQWAMTRFSYTQQYKLSQRLMTRYLSLPYAFFLARNSADLSKTTLHETMQAISGGLLPVMRLAAYGTSAGLIILLLLIMNPVLSVTIALVLAGVYGIIYYISRSWLSRIGKKRVRANQARFTVAAEAFGGAKEIRLLGCEHHYIRRYSAAGHAFARHQSNATLFNVLPQYGIEALAFGGVLALVVFLVATEGGLGAALPLLGLYALAGKQLIPAFQKIFSAIADLRFNSAAIDNVLTDLKREHPVQDAPSTEKVTPIQLKHKLTCRDLYFRYPDAERFALQNLNLAIFANRTTGIIGSSGAGKSTLVDVLLGLLSPSKGEIYVDDVKLTDTNLRSWQLSLGYVPQQIYLADDTVSANIAFGVPKEDIDWTRVVEAAKMANLHDFVTGELQHGYETILGDRGIRLSGGQRQRIGIARALYRNPSVLVFDEATSALDNNTEKSVMDAIYNLAGRKTIIIVAHRLSTIRQCDEIFLMNQGTVLAQGSWDFLQENSQDFRRLSTHSEEEDSSHSTA
ncbi:ABC transporter ATP-binding protein/permease [Ectothiorhodospira haloalkaliphila]|uniref:ABC transporter ATP-binding protein n=1 Tax=Ectothiorhodospira haloalkaliphila TaxID=421628 RepID=UPI001EE7C68C|nr:ABC transporter ATP-binding protein [Ectothiorhodospira haloalkaliphila]MCG5524334.1 ABC transporter ATP-binding protein/permease [Ectothiorhodospira haloalkaliphila]